MILLKSVVSLFLLSKPSLSQTEVSVTTSKGVVIGLRVDTNPATGISYDAFIGIPYGQIPARFQPPVPRNTWSNPLVTQADGPMCPQPDQPFNEDCLYLNVYTPVNASASEAKYPVMAYIHGGAFTFGSSSYLQYGPDFLVSQKVVLVTMNYRVGAAGFLTLGTPEAPGNLGMHDTMLALQWIQEEILVFGGDPTQVTLFGHSAGSILAQLHNLSPASSGLFKRTIAQSGAALTDGLLSTAKEAIRRAKLLCDAVGCNSAKLNASELLTCLQNVDINALVNKQNIALSEKDVASGRRIRFTPVEDKSFATRPFFPDSRENLMKEAVTRAKPLLTGFATGDGIVQFQDPESGWKQAESHLDSFIQRSLVGSLSESKKSAIITKIKERYFPATVDENKILNLINLFTDNKFAYPNIQMSRLFSNFTYGYVFNYQGLWNKMPDYFYQYHVVGVFHGAELTYLFYTTNSSQDVSPCPLNLPDLSVRDNIVSLWTNFAKTGIPDPSGQWGPVSQGRYQLIDSPNSFVNSSEIEEDHYNFWATLVSDCNSTKNVIGDLLVVIMALCVLICMRL